MKKKEALYKFSALFGLLLVLVGVTIDSRDAQMGLALIGGICMGPWVWGIDGTK